MTPARRCVFTTTLLAVTFFFLSIDLEESSLVTLPATPVDRSRLASPTLEALSLPEPQRPKSRCQGLALNAHCGAPGWANATTPLPATPPSPFDDPNPPLCSQVSDLASMLQETRVECRGDDAATRRCVLRDALYARGTYWVVVAEGEGAGGQGIPPTLCSVMNAPQGWAHECDVKVSYRGWRL
jgi:hypothetical protein